MTINISQFKIEKNVPPPQKNNFGMAALARKMEPGDSVVFNTYGRANGLRNRIYEMGHKAKVCQINDVLKPQAPNYRVWKLEEKNNVSTTT